MPTNVLQFSGSTTRVLAQPVPQTDFYQDCKTLQKLGREWASADARSNKLLHQTLLACLDVYRRLKSSAEDRGKLEKYAESRRIKIIENLALTVVRVAFDRGNRPTRAAGKQRSAWAQAIIAMDIAASGIPADEFLSEWGVDQLRRRANVPISRREHFERRNGPVEDFGEDKEEGPPEIGDELEAGVDDQQVDASRVSAIFPETKLLAAHGMQTARPVAKLLRELDRTRPVYLKVLAGRAIVIEGGLQ